MAQRRLPGRPSRYRGKLRAPFSIKLTPEGAAALAAGTQATGLTQSDYVEMVLRRQSHARRGSHATAGEAPKSSSASLSD